MIDSAAGAPASPMPAPMSRFLADLGFKTPPEVDKLAKQSFFVQFSQEQFRLMDQDVVLMYGKREDVLDNPVFKRLDAVREDRVIYLDLTDQFAGALDEAAPQLAAAVDGKPSTKVEQPQRRVRPGSRR